MRAIRSASLCILALLALPDGSRSATTPWPANGSAACVSDSLKDAVCAVPDGSGGVLVVWSDYRTSIPGRSFAYAQRLTADGQVSLGWPAAGFRVCTLDSAQRFPRIAPDGAGGCFVAWQDGRFRSLGTDEVFIQHLTGSGTLSTGWPSNGIQATSSKLGAEFPQVQSDGADGCLVAWDDPIYVQHLLASGATAPGWPPDGLPASSVSSYQVFAAEGSQSAPDGAGGLLLIWTDYRSGSFDVYAQRLSSSGTPPSGWASAGTLLAGSPTGEIAECLASDGAGGMLAVWTGYAGVPLSLQRLSGTGGVAPGWPASGVAVAATYGYHATVTDDGGGGAYVAWPASNGASTNLYLQHVTGAGAIAAGWPASGLVIGTTSGYSRAALLRGAAGGVIVAWNSAGSILAQEFTASGAVASGWPLGGFVLCNVGTAGDVAGATDGALGVITSWTDTRYWRPTGAVFASRVQAGGEVGVGPFEGTASALVSVFPNPSWGGIHLAFQLGSAERVRIAVLDISGREVCRIADAEFPAGDHQLEWNGLTRSGERARPGVYLLRMDSGGLTALKRVALLR